ncbi:hypothetical protein GXW78_04715 [Roseomonas terrae]|jgi:phosphotransferase system  glucose/maltose/N-acetylglucosamine-specific IIC component|uniref:GlsB/YeaQ/YmgE family stress response membrane protein n=1 Tax=Neoroseomonas terrae TaxID=424799 RepID=A0ABS5ED63_9PROT|nr:hypothetical protein [Neoroseomonas terrae]MBR0648953.1 hypothetical protein [Neoroseomonas terrae]
MSQSSPIPVAVAGAAGAMIGRLAVSGWPVTSGDWFGVLALGAVVALGVYVVLRFMARRRQS